MPLQQDIIPKVETRLEKREVRHPMGTHTFGRRTIASVGLCTRILPLILLAFAVGTGCGGGRFLPNNVLDEKTAMKDLPPAVKPLADKEIAGGKVLEVRKGVQRWGNKWIWKIVYRNGKGKLAHLQYFSTGTVVSEGELPDDWAGMDDLRWQFKKK